MNHISLEISLVALLPALVLCGYIYWKDRVEKEPLGLLSLLFGVGALIYVPTFLLEGLISGGADAFFAEAMTIDVHGLVTFSSTAALVGHKALVAFVAVALVEEAIKWGLLVLLTRRSKHFNCLFDGIVYATFLSLGFAAAENVYYAWINGWDTLLLRTLTSVPGHLFFGIMMGFCYTLWHTYSVTSRAEDALLTDGRITVKKIKVAPLWMLLSLAAPLLLHGIYTFAGSIPVKWVTTAFYLLVVVLYALCLLVINRISRHDGEADTISNYILVRKHPELGGATHE